MRSESTSKSFGIYAYLPAVQETTEILHDVQARLRDCTRLAATFGYGRGFLEAVPVRVILNDRAALLGAARHAAALLA